MKLIRLITCALATAVAIPLPAMPTREETARAEPVVKQLLASERAALAAGKKTQSEVADAALKLASEADTEAAKLLLMKGAFVLYVKDGKVEKAARTMNAIEKTIADLPPQAVTNMIDLALLGLPNKNDVYNQLCQKMHPDGRVASMRRPPALAATSSKSPDQRADGSQSPHKNRTTIQSIIDGMIKVPGKDFWLSETELTQGQWEAVMGNNPSEHKGANYPVDCVSRDDVDVFVDKLNACEEVQQSKLRFSLPTPEEWVAAAVPEGSCVLGERSWIKDNSGGQTHEVATKRPNAYGLYDTQGNVWEWLAGPKNQKGARRGGSFADDAEGCRVHHWVNTPRGRRYGSCGFRLAAHARLAYNTATIGGYTWSYRVENDEAVLVGVLPKPKGALTLPSTLSGVRVSRVVEGVFGGSGLTSVTIPEGVREIGHGAFAWIGGLKSVSIPSTVTNIGGVAFISSSVLESFHVAAGNPSYSSRNGMLCSKDGSVLFSGVNGKVVIPEGVTRIGGNAFHRCDGLKSLTIPAGVTTIGSQAFFHCVGLTEVTLPASVQKLESCAFEQCGGLTSVTMLGERPNAPNDVFKSCDKLKEIHVPANAKSWAGMKEWQGRKLVFDAKMDETVARANSKQQGVRTADGGASNGKSVVESLRECDFLLNEDFKKNAKYYLCLFSASWCPPCRREMPRIAKTYAETLKADPEIELILFSHDQNDEKAIAWAKEHDVKFPVVKPNGGNPLNLHTRGIPHLFILKADGTLLEEGHPASLFNEEKIHLLAGKIGQVKANGYIWSYALYKGEVTITSPAGKLYEKAISPNPTGAIVVPSSIAGSTVTRLGKFALCKSPDLTSVKIPATVTSVGDWALSDCDKLVSVNIPSSVARIGNCVFSSCPRLLKIGVDARNPAYKAINGVVYAKDMKRLVTCAGGVEAVTIPAGVVEISDHAFRCCRKLKTITIPMSVTHIGEDAFCATALESVVIPSGVKNIENAAFWCCGRLESVTLHEGLESIGGRAFYQNWRLKSIRIPASVKKLGYGSFEDCRELCDVTMCGERPESSNNVFNKCDKLTEIHVPANAKSWAGMKEWQGKKLVFDAK